MSILDEAGLRSDFLLFLSVQRSLYLLKPILEKCRENKLDNEDAGVIADTWNTLLDARGHVVKSILKRDLLNVAGGMTDFLQIIKNYN